MNHDVTLYLPFPPTVNSYYVKTRNGIYISKKGRLFREAVEQDITEQVPGLFIEDSIFVEVYLHMPDKRKRDLDNYMKALLDALTVSKLWEDDSQIDQLHIYRGETIKKGQVRLEISPAGPVYPLKV